ncbi:23S rRNA (uracil(1939)-C(5))-methyltransferase RlmD [Candidatus Woesearchaeota archaeon]|nr:23S rRNA (uracil(1939)-C(5))-methyltransferase RlmD [Candidatus Woesearchaeota archaeon]
MARRSKRGKKKDFFDKVDESLLTTCAPSCKHFPDCGGCRFQHIKYSDQLQIKKDYLNDLFGRDVELESAPNELEYRNRMDFVYAFEKLGLRKRGNFREVVEINECLLLPKTARDIITKVKSLLAEHAIPSYDFLEHSGFLRYVTIRFAPNTNESMLIFTSTTPNSQQEKELRAIFDTLESQVTSIYWLINDEITDVSIPPVPPKLILGKEYITEELEGITLSYSPWSFFQANTIVAAQMFAEIKKHVHGNTIDLCCGVGAITLFVADQASSIIGIEEVEQAVTLAKKNAQQNNKKVVFFAAPMKQFADFAPLEVDTIIVDPPRSGLERKMVEKLLAVEPKTIIYMSCNPKTQKTDLEYIPKDLYEEVFLQGWDMFAQTPHVETLLVLKRKSV